jgi:1-acyl-sn-glycerol-3-phosphate acyltransferase
MFYYLFSAIILLFLWIDLIILSLLVYTVSCLPLTVRKWVFTPLFRAWCGALVRGFRKQLFIHQKYKGKLPKQFIAISNHPSCFEDFGMPYLFPTARFLSKKEVSNWWIAGRVARAMGVLFVDREDRDSRRQASQKLLETLKTGTSVALFPEGGCKGRKIHLPFLYGAFDVSLQSNVPIIPVFIHYEAQEDFEWGDQHLLVKIKEIFMSRNPRTNYYIYDPIDPKQFEDKDAFCQYVQNLYLHWQDRYLN